MLRGSKLGPEAFALVKEGQTGRSALSCWRACLHKDELGEQGAAIVGRVDDVDSRVIHFF